VLLVPGPFVRAEVFETCSVIFFDSVGDRRNLRSVGTGTGPPQNTAQVNDFPRLCFVSGSRMPLKGEIIDKPILKHVYPAASGCTRQKPRRAMLPGQEIHCGPIFFRSNKYLTKLKNIGKLYEIKW